MAGTAGTPGTPRVLRAMNDRAALDLLLAHGPLSRTRIGKLTGLSKPTASQLLARLEAAGLVSPTGTSDGRPGPERPAVRGQPGRRPRRRTRRHPRADPSPPSPTSPAARSAQLRAAAPRADAPSSPSSEQVTEALDGARRRRPGSTRGRHARLVDRHPRRLRPAAPAGCATPPHLPGWHSPHLLDELAAALPMPVESRTTSTSRPSPNSGSARPADHDDFVLLWAEEGVGAAIVLGGRLHRGCDRRRRRGRLHAAARRAAGPAASTGSQQPAASRSWPAAQAVLAAGPRTRHRRRRTAVRRGRRRPRAQAAAEAPADAGCSTELRAPGWPPGSPRSSPSLDPELVVLRRGRSRRRRAAARAGRGRAGRAGRAPAPAASIGDVHERPRPARRAGERARRHPRRGLRHRPLNRPLAPTSPPIPAPSSPTSPIPPCRTARLRHARNTRTLGRSRSPPPRSLPCLATACTGQSPLRRRPTTPPRPTTIKFWHGWTAPGEVKAIEDNIARFEKTHPNIKVKVVGNITDDKINQALRAGGDKAPTWCRRSPPTTSASTARPACRRTSTRS